MAPRTLDPGSSGRGLSPGWGHYVVLLGKTLFFYSSSLLYTQLYERAPANIILIGNSAMD